MERVCICVTDFVASVTCRKLEWNSLHNLDRDKVVNGVGVGGKTGPPLEKFEKGQKKFAFWLFDNIKNRQLNIFEKKELVLLKVISNSLKM